MAYLEAYLGDDYLGDDLLLPGGGALTPPDVAPPGLPPFADSMEPCDPTSSAFDPTQCGSPAVNASDGSGTYTLPVEVFNSGLRYACVYEDSSIQMLKDGQFSTVSDCPFAQTPVVKVWDITTGQSLYDAPGPSGGGAAPAATPSLFNVIQKILNPGGVPTISSPVPGTLPGGTVQAGLGGGGLLLLAALAFIGFSSTGKKRGG